MAKYEMTVHCCMEDLVTFIECGLKESKMPAVLRASEDQMYQGIKCSLRVYERFDFAASNQSALTLLFFGNGTETHLTAVATGGGHAAYFKLESNLKEAGDDYFLEIVRNLMEKYTMAKAG